MKNKNKDIKYAFTGDVDESIEEHGNTLIKLATVSWNDRPAKLELRKWMVNSGTGELMANKGVTFSSKETVDELTHTLLKLGYGDNKTIKHIMEEERGTKINAFIVESSKDEEEPDEGTDYFDPKELLEGE